MRCLNRNKSKFHYALYLKREPVTTFDEYGNEIQTGEYRVLYGDPIAVEGNISPATGATATELFGGSEGYDKVLMLDNPNLPIDEYSVLWIDSKPTEPFDYLVKKVARSLNSVALAVSKVKVG